LNINFQEESCSTEILLDSLPDKIIKQKNDKGVGEGLELEQKDQSPPQPKRDTQSRRYMLTINDPHPKGFAHEKIKEILHSFKGIMYFCFADEMGSCYHTHIYAVFKSPVRFSTIQKRFDSKVHIENAYADSMSCRAYILKEGEKWEDSDKQETQVFNEDGSSTFYEWGELPQEIQGARNDLAFLYAMVKAGYSNYEILEINPEFMLRITDIERARQTVQRQENSTVFRELDVTYIFGKTATGKTRHVMEKYGYENVYRVTDYKNPFDAYKNQDIMCYDEFSSHLRIQDILNQMDGYPLDLPCRYANKQACYTKVYIISNICLTRQYMDIQRKEPSVWRAFLRRIHKVIHFMPSGERREYTTNDYLENVYGSDSAWVELPPDMPIPFDTVEQLMLTEIEPNQKERGLHEVSH